MPWARVHRNYREQTARATALVRKLSFAGLAAIWVFKTDTPDGPQVPLALFPAAIAFALALLSDLLQYALASTLWMRFVFEHDTQYHGRDLVRPPAFLNRIPRFFFHAKLVAAVAAYLMLIVGLYLQYRHRL